MSFYRPSFALMVLLSTLLHSGVYVGVSSIWGTAEEKTLTDKLIVITLQSKAKPDIKASVEPEVIVKEKELEKEEEIIEVVEEELVEEEPEIVQVTEAKHNMFSNSDKNASNNQTIKGEAGVISFGTTVKVKKKEENGASSQVKNLEPEKRPAESKQQKKNIDVKEIVEIKDRKSDKALAKIEKDVQVEKKESVKEGKARKNVEEKKETKTVNRIISAKSKTTSVSSIDDASSGESDKNLFIKEEKSRAEKSIPAKKPEIKVKKSKLQELAKLEPTILEKMAVKVTSPVFDDASKVDINLNFKEGVGDMKILSDSSLRVAKVKQPYSKKKSKELESYNAFLEMMYDQILSNWKNPYKGRELYQGTAKLVLDANGVLQNVYIYRSSGLAELDVSVVTAIRSIPRFKVPRNKTLAIKKYRLLRFNFNSINIDSELMPFELERQEN